MFIFLSQIFSTFALTGLIWFVQIVHYPLFAFIPDPHHSQYATSHQTRTGWVVAPLMLCELATSLALLVPQFRPASMPRSSAIFGLLLLTLIWVSTALIQVPLHQKLLQGEVMEVCRKLVVTNWIRTTAWTLRSLLLLKCLSNLNGL